MKILTRDEQNYIMENFGIVKVALMDMSNEPVQTAAFVNRIINELVMKIGGKKGAEVCASKVEKLLESFAQKGIDEGLPCDKKV